MAEAKRDANYIPTLLAVSNADGSTPVTLYADPTTHRLLVSATSGSLDDLSDVVITSGAQGDILYNNGTNWVNLAPGDSGKFLKTQGAAANPVWDTPVAGAAGADTQVQFNDGGASLGGDAGMTYNKTTDTLTLAGNLQCEDLLLEDSNASHYLTITTSSDLTAARTLTLVPGDADRSITLAGNINIANNFTTSGGHALTLTTTDTTNVTLPTTGTLATTSNKLSAFAATTSAELAGVISDETGSGALVFGTAPVFPTKITIGAESGTTGSIELKGTTSGTVTLKVADEAGTHTLTLPTTDGDANQFLQTNGSGVLTWASGGTGDVTSSGNITDNVLIKGDGGAKGIQETGITVADTTNNVSGMGTLGCGSITVANGSNINLQEDINFTGATTENLIKFPDNLANALTIGEGANAYITFVTTNDSESITLGKKLILGGDIEMTEKNLVIDTIPASDNMGYGDVTSDHQAAVSLAFPNIVFLNSSGKWAKADADAVATTGMLAMALESKDADTAIKVLLRGFVRDDDWNWTVGGQIYLSTTEAGLTQTKPAGEDDVVQVVGYATHADRMYFNPSPDYITIKA